MKLFSAIIKITGVALLLVAVFGFIAGIFDYVLVIKGSELPLVDGVTAIVLGIVGLVFFAIGYFMLKRAEKKNPDVAPQLDMNNLEFVTKAIARTRRRNYIIGFSLVIFAGLFILIPFADPEADPSSGGSIFIFALSGLMIFLGFFLIGKAMKLSNIQDTEIYRTIMLEPKSVTALQAQIIRNGYTKYGSAINATLYANGKKLPVLSVSENELELLRQYLSKHNPQLEYKATEQVSS